MQKNDGAIIGILIIASMLFVGAVSLNSVPLSVIPGFEGLKSGIEGVEINNKFYRIDQSLPTYYEWEDQTPTSVLLKGRSYRTANGEVRVETGTPRKVNEMFSMPKKVDYWIQKGTSYVHVKGEIVAYEVPVTFSVVRQNTGAGQYIFDGEKFWFTLAATAWDKAVQESSPFGGAKAYGKAWEDPIYGVVQGYNVIDSGLHYKLEPGVAGREITLYDSHAQIGTISDLNLSHDINATLSNDDSPDSRLRQTAYFPITMSDFGITDGVWSSNAPVVTYSIKVYTIQLGKYTYTNPDDTPWGDRDAEVGRDFASLFAGLLGSPSFQIIAIAAGLVLIFVVLFQGAGPALLRMATGGGKQ